MTTPTAHRWRFFRAGGLDQVRFETADDYRNLEHLDPKLWVALACPVKGVEFDEKTFALIDGDKDGRVRVPEIIAAVQWAEDHLRDLAALKQGSDTLPLAQINDATAAGQAILTSARGILRNLGKPDATAISLADVADTAKIFAQTKLNGDGIIPADATDDPALQRVIGEVIGTQGAEADRSGKPGISQLKLNAFFGQLGMFHGWAAQADARPGEVLPLGAATAAAAGALQAVRPKVDDYFARCRLAAFDPRALAAVNRQEAEYLAVAAKDMTISAQEVAGFPLERIEAGRPLSLTDGLNPAWTKAVAAFRSAVVAPLLGADQASLTEAEWTALKDRFEPYLAWAAGKPAVRVEALGLPRVKEILAGGAHAALSQLLQQDLALAPEAASIVSVEKLIRFYRDLHTLLINFVSFAEFYDPAKPAIFQAGRLYLDARACDLCVRVDDPAKHAALAGLSKAYLAYCDCSRPGGEKMSIAAAFTDGDGDNLMVGRNGVFYDRQGRDWDATITRIVENPISIRQAFWSPYKKLVRLIEEMVAKRAAAADAAADAKLAGAAGAVATADKAPPPKKMDVGTVAAISVAIAGIGTLITGLVGYLTGLFTLPFWQLCLAVAGLLLLVSAPSVLIAWLKLRQRNLGPLLDASGWAVNGRVKVPVALGKTLTSVAALPAGTVPAASDQFAEPPAFWPKLVLGAVILGFLYSLLNHFGQVHQWSGGKLGDPYDANRPGLLDVVKPADTNAPPAP